MKTEHDFICERFVIVKQRLEEQEGRMARGVRLQLRREYRLLGKILMEVPEGRELRALEQWRTRFRQQLDNCERNVLPERKRWYREWQQLPPSEKIYYSEPEYPEPELKIRDKSGYTWIVDRGFLKMMDDLIEMLKHNTRRSAGQEDSS